jgi:uncharacterized Tic20 family protein
MNDNDSAEIVPPAGWYPYGAGRQRWWDGTQWTEHAAPLSQRPPTDPKTIAALTHASALILGFIGPLVAYLVYPNDPFIREHGRQALNFQLTLLIGMLISFVLIFVIVGFFTLIGLMIASIVLHIQGTIAASKGEPFRYPLTIEFIKA